MAAADGDAASLPGLLHKVGCTPAESSRLQRLLRSSLLADSDSDEDAPTESDSDEDPQRSPSRTAPAAVLGTSTLPMEGLPAVGDPPAGPPTDDPPLMTLPTATTASTLDLNLSSSSASSPADFLDEVDCEAAVELPAVESKAPPPATAAPAPAPAARRVWIGPDWLTLLEATAAPDAEAVDPRFSAAPAPALPAPCAAAELIVAPKPPRWAGSPRRGDSYSRYEVAAAAAGGVGPLVQEAVRPEDVIVDPKSGAELLGLSPVRDSPGVPDYLISPAHTVGRRSDAAFGETDGSLSRNGSTRRLASLPSSPLAQLLPPVAETGFVSLATLGLDLEEDPGPASDGEAGEAGEAEDGPRPPGPGAGAVLLAEVAVLLAEDFAEGVGLESPSEGNDAAVPTASDPHCNVGLGSVEPGPPEWGPEPPAPLVSIGPAGCSDVMEMADDLRLGGGGVGEEVPEEVPAGHSHACLGRPPSEAAGAAREAGPWRRACPACERRARARAAEQRRDRASLMGRSGSTSKVRSQSSGTRRTPAAQPEAGALRRSPRRSASVSTTARRGAPGRPGTPGLVVRLVDGPETSPTTPVANPRPPSSLGARRGSASRVPFLDIGNSDRGDDGDPSKGFGLEAPGGAFVEAVSPYPASTCASQRTGTSPLRRVPNPRVVRGVCSRITVLSPRTHTVRTIDMAASPRPSTLAEGGLSRPIGPPAPQRLRSGKATPTLARGSPAPQPAAPATLRKHTWK